MARVLLPARAIVHMHARSCIAGRCHALRLTHRVPVVQVHGARAERMKASLQAAYKDLASWEGHVLSARDLRSLAAATAPPSTWSCLDPTPSSEAESRRSGLNARVQGAKSRARLPPDAAALDTLLEEAEAAAACSLAPRGSLVYAPALGTVVARPQGVQLVRPEARSVRPASGERASQASCARGDPADASSTGRVSRAHSSTAASARVESAAEQTQRLRRRRNAPLGSKYLPAWKHVSARPSLPRAVCAALVRPLRAGPDPGRARLPPERHFLQACWQADLARTRRVRSRSSAPKTWTWQSAARLGGMCHSSAWVAVPCINGCYSTLRSRTAVLWARQLRRVACIHACKRSPRCGALRCARRGSST